MSTDPFARLLAWLSKRQTVVKIIVVLIIYAAIIIQAAFFFNRYYYIESSIRYILLNNPPFQPAEGPVGQCVTKVYSAEGQLLGSINSLENVPRPVFAIDDQTWAELGYTITHQNCRDFYPNTLPKKVIEEKGISIFPSVLELSIEDKTLIAGESRSLNAKVIPARRFTSGVIPIIYDRSPWTEISIELDAPSFETSTKDGGPSSMKVSYETVSEKNWVITPKDTSSGKEIINVTVKLPNGAGPYSSKLDLEVKPKTRIDPTWIAIIGLIGAIIFWILTLIKMLIEIWEKIHKSGGNANRQTP